jgi:2-C-methyl-D-erythritol 2,4-cyclodiphosphate synthase
MKLMAHVRDLIEEKGYVIENVDATIVAQKPKLRPYIEQMEENIAKVLRIERDQINVKATTEERLGFTGREEGMAAQAICSLATMYEASVQVGCNGGCGGCQN